LALRAKPFGVAISICWIAPNLFLDISFFSVNMFTSPRWSLAIFLQLFLFSHFPKRLISSLCAFNLENDCGSLQRCAIRAGLRLKYAKTIFQTSHKKVYLDMDLLHKIPFFRENQLFLALNPRQRHPSITNDSILHSREKGV
jgi:hypothetical protein